MDDTHWLRACVYQKPANIKAWPTTTILSRDPQEEGKGSSGRQHKYFHTHTRIQFAVQPLHRQNLGTRRSFVF
ncbi:hypothetical protein Pcinc_019495 [Petrolisthes cinctipes]|uniref:Uncharacterized protein n=1 Tax=Petrolisthes cinctipes TaxID=88211 RepID=A0AAE1FL81_PETCI|nr:hypothetical protein Pcinc_019495 [Petrolisthes cinctipes]